MMHTNSCRSVNTNMANKLNTKELIEGAATALSNQWSESWIARLRLVVPYAESKGASNEREKIVTLIEAIIEERPEERDAIEAIQELLIDLKAGERYVWQ